METQVVENTIGGGPGSMGHDIGNLIKFLLTTKFGLTTLFLLLTIYFFSIWIAGSRGKISLVLWILSLVALIGMIFLTWFMKSGSNSVKVNY